MHQSLTSYQDQTDHPSTKEGVDVLTKWNEKMQRVERYMALRAFPHLIALARPGSTHLVTPEPIDDADRRTRKNSLENIEILDKDKETRKIKKVPFVYHRSNLSVLEVEKEQTKKEIAQMQPPSRLQLPRLGGTPWRGEPESSPLATFGALVQQEREKEGGNPMLNSLTPHYDASSRRKEEEGMLRQRAQRGDVVAQEELKRRAKREKRLKEGSTRCKPLWMPCNPQEAKVQLAAGSQQAPLTLTCGYEDAKVVRQMWAEQRIKAIGDRPKWGAASASDAKKQIQMNYYLNSRDGRELDEELKQIQRQRIEKMQLLRRLRFLHPTRLERERAKELQREEEEALARQLEEEWLKAGSVRLPTPR